MRPLSCVEPEPYRFWQTDPAQVGFQGIPISIGKYLFGLELYLVGLGPDTFHPQPLRRLECRMLGRQISPPIERNCLVKQAFLKLRRISPDIGRLGLMRNAIR